MLFYFFFVFQIFYSISCYISCYEAPSDKNTFNYIITADHFPTELQNSSLTTDSFNCYIEVQWKRSPESTKIILTSKTGEQPVSPDHKLQAEIGYETKGSISIWEQVIIYQCYTDRCNSLSQLKRLLSSLTVQDDLADLTNLLIPVVPFQGQWCFRYSNETFDQCDTTISNDSCTQCQFIGKMNQTGIELCATCSIEHSIRNLIGYEMTFNLTDRTSFSSWMIVCEQDSCNTPAIGEKIRQKSYIDLDYDKFFQNRIERLQINKIFLLFIIFLLKLFQ
jgi:hypothetical protein